MWVEELDIRGFKRLKGTFKFSRTLTIIQGGNEAGKSSLKQALIRALCGFSASDRRRYEGESELDRCKPWNGNPFALNAVVNTDNGRLRIEWHFTDHEVRLINVETGNDLSNEVRAARKEVTLGRFLMGLGLEDFCQACCMDQAEIAAVAHSESLVVALQKAVESGATDTGVDDATELLNTFLRDRIGVRIDNLNPNPRGILAKLQSRLTEIQAILVEATESRKGIVQLEQSRRAQRRERDVIERKLLKVEQTVLREHARSLADRLNRAHEHRGRAELKSSDLLLPSEELDTRISGLFSELDERSQELVAISAQAEPARARLSELETERARLQAQSDTVAGYGETDDSQETGVRDLLGRRAELEASLTSTRETVAEPIAPRNARAKLIWALAAALAIASVVAGVAVSPLTLAGLLLSAAVALLAVGRNRVAVGPSPEAIADRRREVDGELDDALTQVGDGSLAGATIEQRAKAYLAACEQHHKWNELGGKLGTLQGEIQVAREPILERERLDRQVKRSEQELRRLLSDLAIEAGDFETARAEWERRSELGREQRRLEARADEAEEGYRTALGEMSYQQLELEAARATGSLEAHIKSHGELLSDLDPDRSAVDEREALWEELSGLNARLAGVAAQITDREERLPSIPALTEEAGSVEGQIQSLTEAAVAAKTARETVEAAAREARRNFQPHLQRALNKDLERITNGRYRDVEIDDALNINIIAPETGRMIPVKELSRGTQDQIFLVERLEIADLLDPTTEGAPLLLDEPLVHFDDKRLPLALELLGEEAQQRQVFLFTTDPAIASGARECADGAALIELAAP